MKVENNTNLRNAVSQNNSFPYLSDVYTFVCRPSNIIHCRRHFDTKVWILFVLDGADDKGSSEPTSRTQILNDSGRREHSNLVLAVSDYIMPIVDKVEPSDVSDTTHSNSSSQGNPCGRFQLR
jgi:hypothetical protein